MSLAGKTNAQLKAILRSKGLRVSGNKAELLARLSQDTRAHSARMVTVGLANFDLRRVSPVKKEGAYTNAQMKAFLKQAGASGYSTMPRPAHSNSKSLRVAANKTHLADLLIQFGQAGRVASAHKRQVRGGSLETVVDLKAEAKDLGGRLYSKMRKPELLAYVRRLRTNGPSPRSAKRGKANPNAPFDASRLSADKEEGSYTRAHLVQMLKNGNVKGYSGKNKAALFDMVSQLRDGTLRVSSPISASRGFDPRKSSPKRMAGSYNNKQMKAFAKRAGLKGFSKMNKPDLDRVLKAAHRAGQL
jgi:hypothetical protein